MKCTSRTVCFLLLLSFGYCGIRASVAESEKEGWKESLEQPLTTTVSFWGEIKNNGAMTASLAGISVASTNAGAWGCGAGDLVSTPYAEATLVVDKVYICTFTAEDAYSMKAVIHPAMLHKVFDSPQALAQQPNLYKVYIYNTQTHQWEKLCDDNTPGWNSEADNGGICEDHELTCQIQLRRDFGARPVSRPGLKAINGEEEAQAWTHEDGGVTHDSAPGDETPLAISAPRNGNAWSMSRIWEVGLGRLWSGGSAGTMRLEDTVITTNSFNAASIVYSSPTYDTNEVSVLTNLTNTNWIQQVKAPHALVVLTNTSSMSFELRFYTTNYIAGTDTNGFYILATNAASFVTWRVDSPASSTNSYRISEVRNGGTNLTTLTYTNSSGLWTMTRGTGNEARLETRTVTITTSTNSGVITTNRLEVQELKNGAGSTATKTAELYQSMPWNVFELTTITNDPGGANLVTTFTYNTDPLEDWCYEQIASITYPDGYWERREYFSGPGDDPSIDLTGKLQYRINPWKDSPITSTNTDCVVTEYQHIYGNDPRAYISIRWHDHPYDYSGNDFSGMMFAERFEYTMPCQDETRQIEVHETGNTLHYGEYVDTTTYTLAAGPLAGQLSSRYDWTQVMDSYDYIFGTYNSGTRGFTVLTNGLDTEQIIYHGSYAGGIDGEDYLSTGDSGYDIDPIAILPLFSTKDVNLLDDGNLALTRRYVYQGALTNYALLDEVVYQRDSLGHTTNVYRIDPSTGQSRTIRQADFTGTNSFPGDVKLWDIDQTGVKTTYTYDSLKRIKTMTKTGVTVSGYPTQQDIAQSSTYDAADQVLTHSTSGGSLTLTTSATFDKAGRTLTTVDEAGLTNSFGYQLGGRQISMTNSAGATKITLNYLDRRIASITGSAQVNEFYDYALTDTSMLDFLYPKNITTKTLGSTNSTRWSNNITDQRLKPAREESPAFHSANVRWKEYFTETPSDPGYSYSAFNVDQMFRQSFDWYGRKLLQSNTDAYEIWPPSSLVTTERIHTFNSYFETNSSGHWFHVQGEWSLPFDNSDTNALFAMTKTRLTGFPSNQVSEVWTFDAMTNQTTAITLVDLSKRMLTATTNLPSSTLVATQIVINGLLERDSTESVSLPTWHYYDALGREIAQTDPLGFTSGKTYSGSTGQLIATTNRNGQVVSLQYYAPGSTNAGQLYCQNGPTGKKTYFGYNMRGQPIQTWGDVAYPELRTYNQFGDLATLSTYRGASSWNGSSWPTSPPSPDTTTWSYDEPTGLLTNKVDAASHAVTFDYNPNCYPLSRTWARGGGSTNYYSDNGDLSQIDYVANGALSSVYLSDYNRLGLPRLIQDDSGYHVLSYDNAARVLSDACTNGIQTNLTVSYRYDQSRGKDMVKLATPSGSVTNYYGFDTYGRVSGVTNGNYTVAYGYVPNSDLISTTTSKSSGSTVLTATRTWDFGYRLRSIANVAGSSSVASFNYVYDALDRRTRATLVDNSAWVYDYDDRDEVTRADRVWADQSSVAGQQFAFAYDNIGNRTSAKEGGDSNGLNLRSESYTANNLNQYTVRNNSSYNDVIGAAFAGATVTVNGNATTRNGEYFDYALSGGNSSTALWQSITNTATLSTNSASETGALVLPPLNQTFTYDLDGNMTFDGVWNYKWDAENRMVSMNMTNVSGIPNASRKKLDFAYDHEGKRVRKVVSTWNGSSFGASTTNCLVYDGWNLLAELNSTNGLLRSYTWGLDLTGELDEAGGIGAMLMMTEHTNSAALHFSGYDGNGNVAGLIRSDGTTTAQYEYGAFGESLRTTGAAGKLNPFRFSTRFVDNESGLLCYPYRFYSACFGRWLNRDPLGERAGASLLCFLKNAPINGIDPLGRFSLLDTEGADALGEYVDAGGAVQALGIYQRVKHVVELSNQIVTLGESLMDAVDKADFSRFSLHVDTDDLFVAAATATVQAVATAFNMHHTMTVRHTKWTPAFDQLLGTVGLSLNDTFVNILNVSPVWGHSGPHEKYNEMVYNYLLTSMNKVNTRRDKQLIMVSKLVELAIRNNIPGDPFHEMLTKEGRQIYK